MEETQKSEREQRNDDQHEQHDKPRDETEQRPSDLDPKDQGKDIRGGGAKFRF